MSINQQLNSYNTNRFYFARALQNRVDISAAITNFMHDSSGAEVASLST